MERIINGLKEQRDKAKETFIEKSLIKYFAKQNSPIPNTDAYLKMIIELNKAISVLQDFDSVKCVNPKTD